MSHVCYGVYRQLGEWQSVFSLFLLNIRLSSWMTLTTTTRRYERRHASLGNASPENSTVYLNDCRLTNHGLAPSTSTWHTSSPVTYRPVSKKVRIFRLSAKYRFELRAPRRGSNVIPRMKQGGFFVSTYGVAVRFGGGCRPGHRHLAKAPYKPAIFDIDMLEAHSSHSLVF